MSQKSSGMQLPQFVPKALTSDIVLETGIRGVAHAFSKCDRVVSYTTLWDTTYRHCPMFTVVAPTTSLSLDDHFIKRPAATFFVTVEGDGMAEHGILAGDILIVDRSRTPGAGSIVIAAIEGELTARPLSESLSLPPSPPAMTGGPGEVFERAGWRQQTQCKRPTWRGLFGSGEAE